MQSAKALLLKQSAFPIRSLAGAVVKTEDEETTTPSLLLSHFISVVEPPSAQTVGFGIRAPR